MVPIFPSNDFLTSALSTLRFTDTSISDSSNLSPSLVYSIQFRTSGRRCHSSLPQPFGRRGKGEAETPSPRTLSLRSFSHRPLTTDCAVDSQSQAGAGRLSVRLL